MNFKHIFGVEDIYIGTSAKICIYFFGIKISLRKKQSVINIGNNNKIIYDLPKNVLKKLHIYVKGNNNTIILESGVQIASSLIINIGGIPDPYTIDNSVVRIGKNTYCGDVKIWVNADNSKVDIGEDCMLSQNIIFRTGEFHHLIFNSQTGEYIDNGADIAIGNHVWICDNSVIMKKAKVANNSIIGVNSVVTRQFTTPNSVIAGNPAKMCKNDIDWLQNERELSKYPQYARSYYEKKSKKP